MIHFSPRYLKFILPLAFLMGFMVTAHAQNTTLASGVLTDSDSQVWGLASIRAVLVVPGGANPVFSDGTRVPQPVIAATDITGTVATPFAIGANSKIVPNGTTWTFNVCSLTSAQCQAITGVTVPAGATWTGFGTTISAQLQGPRIQAANLVYAYNTGEVLNPVQGDGYTNTLSNTSYLFDVATQTWTPFGGGGCTGGSVTGNVAFSGQVGQFQSGCLASVGNPFGAGINCPQAGSREIGNSTTSPFSCTFSYSNGTPSSASFTDGTNSQTLTTPFTSGSLAFVYSTNHTFTVNATATNSQTTSASTGLQFLPREFSGLSATNTATGATASGNTAVLVGATGTLASAGLGQQTNWGTFNPSSQYIYILGTGSACTFTSGGFNFPMASPVPVSFVNQYGSTVSMYLYISTNSLNVPFAILGTC